MEPCHCSMGCTEGNSSHEQLKTVDVWTLLLLSGSVHIEEHSCTHTIAHDSPLAFEDG